jgi:proteasome ATPase
MANEDYGDLTQDQFIDREVQRRMAAEKRRNNEVIGNLQQDIKLLRDDLIKLHRIVTRVTGEPLCFGTLLRVQNEPDLRCYKKGDEIIVVDPQSRFYQEGGRIIGGDGSIVDEKGFVNVELYDGTTERFAAGAEGQAPAQIRLAKKDDGTFAVVSIDGKPWEVRGVSDLDLKIGDPVKVTEKKQIVAKGYNIISGPICTVSAISDSGVEIMDKSETHLVQNPSNFALEEGDRVVVDPGHFVVMNKLPRDARTRYQIKSDFTTTWDDVGGLEKAKARLRDILELPYTRPEVFDFLKIKPADGVLLHGPPGCGKTLLARVMAWSLAKIHNASIVGEDAYIFVKGPEILDKWVGNSEKEIRSLFDRGRRHYRKHGYKAILAIDEADAIMPQRGMRRSSDIADTLVPMFLGEMQGIDDQQNRENPLIILMSNRPDMLDPAITRPGRISHHIKVERPTEMTALDILKIHTRNMPFADEDNRIPTLAVAVADLFSKSRLLYRINNEHDFTLGHAVNGAMLESLGSLAGMICGRRNIENNTLEGVTTADFRSAVDEIYQQQRGLNHSYDLQDFAEKIGIQAHTMKTERCFGAA